MDAREEIKNGMVRVYDMKPNSVYGHGRQNRRTLVFIPLGMAAGGRVWLEKFECEYARTDDGRSCVLYAHHRGDIMVPSSRLDDHLGTPELVVASIDDLADMRHAIRSEQRRTWTRWSSWGLSAALFMLVLPAIAPISMVGSLIFVVLAQWGLNTYTGKVGAQRIY